MPQRIQRRRTAGWRMPEGAVYVGRPSRWGNPFEVVPVERNGFRTGFWTVVDNNGVDYREPRTGWADKSYAVLKSVRLFYMDVKGMIVVAGSEWTEKSLSDFILKALDSKAYSMSEDVADDAGVELLNPGDCVAELTIREIS